MKTPKQKKRKDWITEVTNSKEEDGKRYVEFILVIGNRTNTNDEWDGSYISRK